MTETDRKSAAGSPPGNASSDPITLSSLKAALGQIKPLNQTALDLIRSIDDETLTSIAVLTDKICMDQVMVSRILKVTNSPFYGMSGHITSIQEAIAVLGYRSLRSLAIAVTLDNSFGKQTGAFRPQTLWPERVFVAYFAHHMAPLIQLSRDTAYSIGLLYDIGKLVLYTLHPDRFSVVSEMAARENILFAQAEHRLFDFSYAEVGELVCESWNIPKTITQAIAGHLDPPMRQAGYALLLHAAVSLYELVKKVGFTSALIRKADSDPVFRYLGFTHALCEKHVGNLQEEVQQTIAMLSA